MVRYSKLGYVTVHYGTLSFITVRYSMLRYVMLCYGTFFLELMKLKGILFDCNFEAIKWLLVNGS